MSSRVASLRLSARAEPKRVEVDARATREIMTATKSGGRISSAEMQRSIIPAIGDGGGRVGAAERALLELLDAARDERRKVTVDGARVRMTLPAKRVWNLYRAGLEGLVPAQPLTEPMLRERVSEALRAWYAAEVERRIGDLVANDPERAATYDETQRSTDRGWADNPRAFLWNTRAFAVRYDDNIAAHWLEGRDDTAFPYSDGHGRKIALADVAFVELNYDPIYAGQQLTSWFAFDKRTGQLLEHFGTEG